MQEPTQTFISRCMATKEKHQELPCRTKVKRSDALNEEELISLLYKQLTWER